MKWIKLLAVTWVLAAGSMLAASNGLSSNPGVPWPATDGLGRKLPLSDEVGPPHPDRFVGAFYFLWHGRHGHLGPFDISKILAQDPTAVSNPASPLWGPMYSLHHWGESIFDYYVSEDEAVLRKHAQMLADAGVDVIIFDTTNQRTYPESWRPLCRVFEQVRQAGGRTPQIAFLCPFGDPHKVVQEMWEQMYSRGLYSDLWFRWKGKPLILADPNMMGDCVRFGETQTPDALTVSHSLGQSFVADKAFSAVAAVMPTWSATESGVTLTLFRDGPKGSRLLASRFEKVQDGSTVKLKSSSPLAPGRYYLEASLPQGTIGWWSDAANAIPGGQSFADGKPVAGEHSLVVYAAEQKNSPANFFTFRKPQPDYFVGPTQLNQWGWLEVYPQHVFSGADGAKEEMTVGVSQNAVGGKVGCFNDPKAYGRSYHDGMEPEPNSCDYTGRNFDEQWRRVLAVNPEFIFITSWNEWTAGRFDKTMALRGSGPVTFVDEFSEEFSRDIEPMQGGHGDDYYYQMIANIRRYKGVPAIPPVRSQPILMDGHFADWAKVEPEFADTPDDPVHRSSRGWGEGTHYDNQTGRNDIVAAKVSLDATTVYFYVRTKAPLTSHNDPNWMLLFIDADQNAGTGWLGYDFVVNRINPRDRTATLERNLGGYHWGMPEDIPYRMAGNELELAIPRATLGVTNLPAALDFKWADNIQQTGEASDFTLNGDAAPNDRYNFRARFEAASLPGH